ncbi:hypothetical protein EON64_13540 [archaeon]|nr:MAG: hypothetical protein EON64_13540 [archaeon]
MPAQDKAELQSEVLRLQKELANSNRHEASESWKKITATSRELRRVEEENEQLKRVIKEAEADDMALKGELNSVKDMLNRERGDRRDLERRLGQ